MPDKPLDADEKKWKTMIDEVDDPSLLKFICDTAENNPNYEDMANEASDEGDNEIDDKEGSSIEKKSPKGFPPMNADKADENYGD